MIILSKIRIAIKSTEINQYGVFTQLNKFKLGKKILIYYKLPKIIAF